MSRTSKVLLPDTAGQTNPVGYAIHGAAYYGLGAGVHTIAVYNQNFTGRLYIEAALATCPTESDWIEVDFNPGDVPVYVEYTISTGVFTYNFTGNYIWVRARVDRTYLPSPADPAHGTISKILLNI